MPSYDHSPSNIDHSPSNMEKKQKKLLYRTSYIRNRVKIHILRENYEYNVRKLNTEQPNTRGW